MFGSALEDYFGGANAIYDDNGLGPLSGKEIANLILANLDSSLDPSSTSDIAEF